MQKQRLDHELTSRGLVPSRSQAESWIRLGKVTVDGEVVTKPGFFVQPKAAIQLHTNQQYVSRAGLKLASVAELLQIDFRDKRVLDIGSSTGGFTDYALQHGAKQVIAVDVGTDQLHPSLQGHPAIELHEKTDIRDCYLTTRRPAAGSQPQCVLPEVPHIIVIDVSFISLRQILPHVAAALADDTTQIIAMMKPQFEARHDQTHKGVIKNKAVRRHIIKQFEQWASQSFVIQDKRDSAVAGSKGNQERFYVLTIQ